MTAHYEFGRRPKKEDFDDLEPMEEGQEYDYEDEDGDEDYEKDEEVDFDNPRFKRDQIWNDYAEDLDFDDN
jgi:hypothetical protein